VKRKPSRSRRKPRFGLGLDSLEGRRLLSYGAPGPVFQVNQTVVGGQSAPKAAVNERGQVAVIWEDFGTDGSGYGVYARRLDSAGQALGAEFRVNTATEGDQTDPRVAVRYSSYLEDGLIATWRDGGKLYAQRYDAQGAAVGGAMELAGSAGVGADYDLVGLPGGGFLIVSAGGVLGYGPEGAAAGSSTPGAGHEGWTPQAPAAGRAGILYYDQAVTTWAETRSREVEGTTVYDARIWAQALDSQGGLSGPEVLIAEIQGAATPEAVADLDPVVVRPRGYYGEPIIAWRQAGAEGSTFHARNLTQDYDTNDLEPDGDAFELATSTPADAVALAWLDGSSLAAFFIGEDPAGPDGGYFQIFGARGGAAQGDPVPAPDVAADSLATLAVVPTVGGDFWLVWGDPQVDPTAGEVHAQRQFTTDSEFHLVGDDQYLKESDGRAVLFVVRSGDLSQPASIRYATHDEGSALPGYDYAPTSGVLTFAPGQAEGTITITIVDDAVAESYDYFSVQFTDTVGAAYNGYSAYVSIEDDEPASNYAPVFVDYDAYGLWTYNPIEGWAQLSTYDPEAVVSTYRRDAYIDFGAGGLWYWHPQSGWAKLNDVDPQAVKVDPSGDGVYIDFGAGGLWRWTKGVGYRQISPSDPQDFLAGYDGLAIDFGHGGLWKWSTTGTWAKLNDVDPKAMIGDPSGTLYIDFGAGGLWSLDEDGVYAKISDFSPRTMKLGYDYTADDYEDVLYLDFGSGGFWKWGGISGWAKLNDLAPESFVDDGFHSLFIDFGHGGLWSWSKADGYRQLNTVNPELIAFSAVDDGLYIDFGSAGFWRWTKNGGYTKINDANPTAFSLA